MKRKTMFRLGAMTLAACSLLVGLTACGEDAAEALVSDEVTKEVAETAVKEENFNNCKAEASFDIQVDTYSILGSTSTEPTSSTTASVSLIVTLAEPNIYAKATVTGNMTEDGSKTTTTYEVYYDTENGNLYTKDDNGNWKVTTEDIEDIEQGDLDNLDGVLSDDLLGSFDMDAITSYLSSQITPFIPSGYEDFTYDKDKKGYVYSKTVQDNSVEFIVKYKDEKLAAVLFDLNLDVLSMKVAFSGDVYVTYGGQKVTLPKVSQ
jgi:hypothetical protein